MPTLPFKLNQDRRHHIPRQKHKVMNWPADDASLRQRGSLTVWFTDEAIAAWEAEPRTTRGGQPWYSELAILTALTLRAVFRLGPVDGFDDDEAQSECDEGSEVPVRFLAAERNALEALELADELLDAGAGAIERLREERWSVPGG